MMETDNKISVLEPIGHAVNKTKQILFSPFNFEKWLLIGFCAWLASLGSGGSGGFNIHANIPSEPRGWGLDLNAIGQEITTALAPAMAWLIPAGIALVFFVVAIALLIIWLKSRGQFMFLDCIVSDRGAVSAPWRTYKAEGNSLFGFKFVLWVAAFALTLAAIVPLIVMIVTLAQTDFKVLLIGPIVGAGLLTIGLFLMWTVYSTVMTLTDDFVVPVMYLRRCGVTAAWKELMPLLSAYPGRFILYLLLALAAGIALGVMTSMIALAACCCFCCVSWVFLIPVIGRYLFTVLILPLRIWRRSYAILFFSQFGQPYNVFAAAQASASLND